MTFKLSVSGTLCALCLTAAAHGAEVARLANHPTAGTRLPQAPGARFIESLQAGKKVTVVTMGTSLTGGAWRGPDVMMNDWLNREWPGQVTLFNEGVMLWTANPTKFDARVTIVAENERQAQRPLGNTAFLKWPKTEIKSGQTIQVIVNPKEIKQW